MTDLRRIVDGDSSDAARVLLRAAAAEQPSRQALERTLARVGAAASIAAAGGAAAKATAGAARALTLAKWAGLSLFLGAAVTLGIWLSKRPAAPELATVVSSAPASASSAPETATSVATPVEESATAVPSIAAIASSAAAAASAHPASSTAASASAKPAAMSLAAEVTAIDAARTALRNGDVAGCLNALDHYQHDFPHGLLGQEANVLRIEAMLRGNRPGARAAAERFLAANPSSPYATRIRSLLGGP